MNAFKIKNQGIRKTPIIDQDIDHFTSFKEGGKNLTKSPQPSNRKLKISATFLFWYLTHLVIRLGIMIN